MALEAINNIRKSEEQAEKIIKDATLRSKEIIKEASILADEEYKKIIDSANLKKKEIIKKAEDDGNNEAKPILDKGEIEVQKIKNISTDKIMLLI